MSLRDVPADASSTAKSAAGCGVAPGALHAATGPGQAKDAFSVHAGMAAVVRPAPGFAGAHLTFRKGPVANLCLHARGVNLGTPRQLPP